MQLSNNLSVAVKIMRKIFLVVLILTGLASHQANAATAMKGYFDGNRLYADCKNESDPTSQGFCVGYISGLVDLDLAYASVMEGFRPQYCLRNAVNPVQLKDIVIQYLEANAEKRQYPAVSNVMAALANAFPCPKQKGAEAP